ncbi:MAG: helix-turn-helix domain-containing protein [Eubacteriales bacterium]|nr:helix-turn-helix domain-containing protein [Eubacteriales bacterium]
MLYKINMKSREFSLLLYLIDRCDKEYTCFPSIKTISSELKISVSTTKRGLISLCENGYIEKIERFSDISGRQTSNLYVINIDKIKSEYTNISKNINSISEEDVLNEIENEQLKQKNEINNTGILCNVRNLQENNYYFNINNSKNKFFKKEEILVGG